MLLVDIRKDIRKVNARLDRLEAGGQTLAPGGSWGSEQVIFERVEDEAGFAGLEAAAEHRRDAMVSVDLKGMYHGNCK